MQYAPPYIVKYLQDRTIDDMQISDLILATKAENERDQEYIYTFSIMVIRTTDHVQLVLDMCEKYLPFLHEKECRSFIQTIRIWKYEQLEQHDKAIALRLEQIEEYPDEDEYYQKLAKAYKERKDNPNAIKYYEQYMAMNNYNVDSDEQVELAEWYEEVKDFKNCAKYHEMAAAHEARFSEEHWQKTGRALALDGQIDEAMFYFKFASKIDPKNAYTHYYLGHSYQQKKDKYRALHHYTLALKYKPDFLEAQLNIGAMEFNEEGDVKAAIQCFEELLEKDTEGSIQFLLYRNLRMLHKKVLNFEKSEYYRGKIFELAGFPADTGEYLDSLEQGEHLDFSSDNDDLDDLDLDLDSEVDIE